MPVIYQAAGLSLLSQRKISELLGQVTPTNQLNDNASSKSLANKPDEAASSKIELKNGSSRLSHSLASFEKPTLTTLMVPSPKSEHFRPQREKSPWKLPLAHHKLESIQAISLTAKSIKLFERSWNFLVDPLEAHSLTGADLWSNIWQCRLKPRCRQSRRTPLTGQTERLCKAY